MNNIDDLSAFIRTKSLTARFDESLRGLIELAFKGGEDRLWRVRIEQGQAQVALNEAELVLFEGMEPDVRVTVDESTILKMAQGKMSPAKAFLLGKVKFKGDIRLLGQLKSLWPES
ncbi:MAG: SCP2 sterol-binding domain-containing protein [Deltaproteobacteria bacterium]|jgi:putative sterol carrier protein|nr:SCP2 sterol-binding domain-containing protein [Deltaproteobacteria bacterium]